MSEYLPPEIITLVLKRLPAESVVRCTAVCKSWYALIKHPSFISTHLQRAAASLYNVDLLLLRFIRDERDLYHLRRDNDAFEEYKQFRFPFHCRNGSFRVVGTSNGLICLAIDGDQSWNIILWNPSIHKHFILPKLDLSYWSFHESTLGFGFDSASNDYKVLVIVLRSHVEKTARVCLFSLNSRSWMRYSGVMPTNQSWFGRKHAVFLNGTFHCPAYSWDSEYRNSNMISLFDISTEKFCVMNYPETLNVIDWETSLIKYEESIAVVRTPSIYLGDKQCELWVMKEYGVNSSWTKVLHSVDENEKLVFDPYLIDVFGVRKNGKVLLEVREDFELGVRWVEERDGELATYDPKCHPLELKHHVGMWINSRDSYVGSFVESLVLLDIGEEDIETEFEVYKN